MSIEAFEKREEILKMRSKIFDAEQSRVLGEPTVSISEARKLLEYKFNEEI